MLVVVVVVAEVANVFLKDGKITKVEFHGSAAADIKKRPSSHLAKKPSKHSKTEAKKEESDSVCEDGDDDDDGGDGDDDDDKDPDTIVWVPIGFRTAKERHGAHTIIVYAMEKKATRHRSCSALTMPTTSPSRCANMS